MRMRVKMTVRMRVKMTARMRVKMTVRMRVKMTVRMRVKMIVKPFGHSDRSSKEVNSDGVVEVCQKQNTKRSYCRKFVYPPKPFDHTPDNVFVT